MEENKMGVMPVNGLIISMSLPIMASMLVQALYNIVDSIFVAKINENALTAVSMAFPIQNLMIAVGVGTAVGVNALLARSLGEKDFKKVNKIAENAVFLTVLSYLLFLIIGVFFVDLFYRSQTDIEEIVRYGKEYLTVCCCFSFGVFTQVMFERLLQATGKTIYSMITQGVGAIVNIILDPIMIFGLFGFPKMGVTGAAAATVIGQIVAGILAVWMNHTRNHEVRIQMKGFRPELPVIGQIYGIGVPSIIMQAIGSVMTYGMNRILISFTSTATAVFGVYFKLQSFVFMPVFGLNNGVIPIVAYNYGAKNTERVISAIRYSIAYAMSIMVAGLLVFQILPGPLLKLFNASEMMMEIGIPALRIISMSFLLAGFCIACGSVFQALGCSVYSMYVSVARQLVVLLPAAWFLAKLGNVNLVWWAIPIAELMSLAMTVYYMIRVNQKVISKIKREDASKVCM
ncbi:MAG: MATE family efflux transporter [Lachnospiraceae bacterium]|nr:MATE family efflux transporter [Lachnospiraceae bacterium]MCI9657293.1 MATE family efflux transporter [Lachnospiraceae bacterium]